MMATMAAAALLTAVAGASPRSIPWEYRGWDSFPTNCAPLPRPDPTLPNPEPE